MSFAVEFSNRTFWFFKEASLYILVGILAAGYLRFLISDKWFTRLFKGDDFRSAASASILGIPLPLCSCSVLPMMITLRQRGASKGATTSFLISTPETGVESISITYALLDPIFTVARPIAAFVSALFTGTLVNIFVRRGWDKDEEKDGREAGTAGKRGSPAPAPGSGTSADDTCGCKTSEKPECAVGAGGSADAAATGDDEGTLFGRAIRYGFITVMDDLTPLLIPAFIISGLIAAAVPQSVFQSPVTQGWSGMIIMLFVGIPFYVCATSSTPLVAAMLLKGLSPGAALVFLLAGPVTNVGTIVAVHRFLGRRVMLIYLASTACLTLVMGGIVDLVYSSLDIPVSAIVGRTTGLLPEPVKLASMAALLLLIVSSARRTGLMTRWWRKLGAWRGPRS